MKTLSVLLMSFILSILVIGVPSGFPNSILMSYYTMNGVANTSAYFGSSEMSEMTAAVENCGKNQVTFVLNFENLSQMLQYDALWLQRRDMPAFVGRDYGGSLTNLEIGNIQSFISTGRRVIMFGEWGSWPYSSDLGWTKWDNQILSIVGGSYDSAYGDTPVDVNPVKSLNNQLTEGVNILPLLGNRYGAAVGGLALFQPNIASLWGDNVLTILDTGLFLDTRWNLGDNGTFGLNVANWITTPVPEPANQPPVTLCQNVTAAAGPSCTAPASIDNGSYDPDSDPITLTQSPAGPYPKGNTLVTLTVTDSQGASSQCTGAVSVVDKTPPAIPAAWVNPSVLWPPNNKMVNETVNYNVTDNCTPTSDITCALSLASNEPISGSDYTIVDVHHVKLRADRLGSGSGRIYTITITCKDTSGNSSEQTMTVTVPHDQGNK